MLTKALGRGLGGRGHCRVGRSQDPNTATVGSLAWYLGAEAKVKAFESGGQWQSILSLGRHPQHPASTSPCEGYATLPLRLGTQPGGGAAGMVSAVSACEEALSQKAGRRCERSELEASEWARTTALLLQARPAMGHGLRPEREFRCQAPLPPEAQQVPRDGDEEFSSLRPSVAAWNSAMASEVQPHAPLSRRDAVPFAVSRFAVQGWRAALSSLDRPDPGSASDP